MIHGELNDSVNLAIQALQQIIQQFDILSSEGYSSDVSLRSIQDKLGIVLQRIEILRNAHQAADKSGQIDTSAKTKELARQDLSVEALKKELERRGNELSRNNNALYKAHQALLAKEQEQHDLIDSIVDAVITIDETGIIYSFNKSAEALFGYSFDEIIGKNISRLMPDHYATRHNGYLQQYLKTGKAQIVGIGREVEGQHKNKQTFPMRLSVAKLMADDKGKRRYIGTCHDLTFTKKQEEQLHRTQKMDALGQLTGGIAHDYNNMLGVVLGYAELLEGALNDQPKLAKYAHEIHHAGERGVKLTSKLLSFSRKKTTTAVRLDLNSLVQNQRLMLEKTLTVRIKLELDLAKDLWDVCLDNGDVEDAILNISINAMHAMEGNGRLRIQTCNQIIKQMDAQFLALAPGDYVLLSFTDTGCGMDKATQDRMFEPFFSTKGEQGTGLGLSQVFGFVRSIGGTIKVYSEPGHGTRMAIYFPRYHESVHKEQQSLEKNNVLDIKGTETILMVDDEPALLGLGCEILAEQGFNVILAESAKKAMDILEHETVDVLITDIIMPEMDGYHLASIVKEKYPHIKIQLTSGFSDDRKMGMENEKLQKKLLLKPFNVQALLLRIHDLLNEK